MIKLELNSTDELALRHMGNALTAMASEIKSVQPQEGVEQLHVVTQSPTFNSQQLNRAKREVVEEVLRLREVVENEPDVTDEPVKYGKSVVETLVDQVEDINDTVSDNLDSNGLPWDGRIHSSSKTKIKDGSWKKRKGVDAETLTTVEAELTALMAIPVVEAKQDESMEYTEFNEEKFEQAMDVVTGDAEQPTPPAPEPIVPKPQDATPPPPPVVDASVGITQDDVEAVSFVEITRFITGTMVKEMGYTIPEVNNILTAEYGVTFSTLKANEALFPQVLAFLKGQPKK